ncbi:MAG: hypothetical protein WCE64_13755 [Bacteroidales bacterium]
MINDYLTILSRIILVILLLAPVPETAAQRTVNGTDDVYGSDPLLYNGKFYTFFSPLNAGGNQYLNDRQFEPGTVTLRGVKYTDLLLNYDIYNQQLLLEYKGEPGLTQVIILSDAWLETFSIKDKNFRIFQISDNEKRIYQEIGADQTRVLYFWKKYRQVENITGGTKMIFTKPAREMNLLTDGKIVTYRNNRSFVNLFGPENKEVVREYIHGHRVNVKKASDKIMAGLINYVNTPGGK